MKKFNIGKTDLIGSEVIVGCMNFNQLDVAGVEKMIDYSLDNGINYFDHADIYGSGVSEEIFGKAFKHKRDDVIIQTKCGIHQEDFTYFDFSKDYIINCVDKSLKRLNTDYIDTLLLHRPDTLVEPDEVAEAFNTLEKAGKVRYFGVSNQNPMQIKLLNKYLNQKIIINQLQLSITNCPMIDQGFNVNMENSLSIDHDGSILDYCRLEDITIQAWSPFRYGFFEGIYIDDPKYPKLNKVLEGIASKYDVTKESVVTSWILTHPASIQIISGTTKVERLSKICDGTKFKLTKKEWYELYLSSGKKLP